MRREGDISGRCMAKREIPMSFQGMDSRDLRRLLRALESVAKIRTRPALLAALTEGGARESREGAFLDAWRRLGSSDPFIQCALRDVIENLVPPEGSGSSETRGSKLSPSERRRLARQARELVELRLASLENWNTPNETVEAIRSGLIDVRAIRPHLRPSDEAVRRYYENQDREATEKGEKWIANRPGGLDDAVKKGPVHKGRRNPFPLAMNVNHALRETQATALIEFLFGLCASYGMAAPIRWLDVACGRGKITNAVDPTRYAGCEFEILGVDMQNSRIGTAARAASEGRSFKVGDALDFLRRAASEGAAYHIISMFEFLEHLPDPLGFLRNVAQARPVFVVAGSPLEQKIDAPFDRKLDGVHLWSFSRKSWEQMFELAGLETVISGEMRIGAYLKGLDWLTMVAGPRDLMAARRTNIYAGDEVKAS